MADLRRRAGLTQKELGAKLGLTASYRQKRVSQLESGLIRPNTAELRKLTDIFGVSRDELEVYLSDEGSYSALELLNRLASLQNPAILAVCYSGRPRIFSDPIVQRKYVEALQRKLCVAMFLPYPLVTMDSVQDSTLLLTAFYRRVWGSVFSLHERFLAEISPEHLEKHVGIYGPQASTHIPDCMIPPFFSRYSLLVERIPRVGYRRSLYLALETAKSKTLQLVGTSDDDAADEQIQTWEAYFGPVVREWMKDNHSLPRGDKRLGHWKYYPNVPAAT